MLSRREEGRMMGRVRRGEKRGEDIQVEIAPETLQN